MKTGAVAVPVLSVLKVTLLPPPAKVPLAPAAGAVNVTLWPLPTALPDASVIFTESGIPKAWPNTAVCGVPLGAIAAGVPGRFVRLKLCVSELTVAVTRYGPALVLAVNAGAVAMPEALVATVAPPPKLPLGPEAGALKVTLTPEMGVPCESVTLTASAVPNAVEIAAD